MSQTLPPALPPTVIMDAEEGRNAWQQAVAEHNDVSPFLHPTFLDGIERILPWRRLFVRASSLGTASVFLRQRGPVRDIVLHPFSPYSALLFDAVPPSPNTAEVASLLMSAPQLPTTRLFSLPPGIGMDRLGTAPESTQARERFTYHLPSLPLERAVEEWSTSQRRTFRRHNGSFTYSMVDAGTLARSPAAVRAGIAETVQWVQAGYARHRARMPLASSGLQQLSEDLIRDGLGQLHILRDTTDKALAAGVLVVRNSHTAWYWLAGSEPGPAMTVLLGYLQDNLYHTGVSTLDLMGANTPGIAEFKRRFGGTLVSYLHIRTASWAGLAAERAALWYHRLRP